MLVERLMLIWWSIAQFYGRGVFGFISGESSKYVLEDPKSHFRNDDYSQWTPLLETGGRVIELINGEFFDDHLRDTPDHMRPPSVVAFYNSFDPQCMERFNNLDFDDTVRFHLPSRAFLFAAKYVCYFVFVFCFYFVLFRINT